MQKKEVTIYDIAAEMKISASTVSRALSNNKSINSETIHKVLECAEKMGYRSNRFASNLRRQRTQTIGIIVPRLDSSFMSACLAGMEEVANQEGYNVIISQSFEQVEKEVQNAKTMFNNRVDGIMVSLAANTREINHFIPFMEKGIPVVFFDRVPCGSEHVSFVIDNFGAARQSCNHLIGQGCTYLAHITLEQKASVYIEREKGFFAAISENKGIEQLVLRATDLSIETGIGMAMRLVRHHPFPDGVFVANDLAAVGIILGLQKLGVKVPEQVAVVGFNNDPISKVVIPNLSTVNYPGKETGRVTARSLIDHLEGRGNLVTTGPVVLDSSLIVRESSKRF